MVETLVQTENETHFEVHVLKNGRWMIEATSKDKATALEDAKSLVNASDVRAIKVFKETTNHELGRSAAISIFTHVKMERRQGPRLGPAVQSRAAVQPLKPRKPAEPKRPARAATRSQEEINPSYLAIAATAVVMALAAALYLATVTLVEPEPEPESGLYNGMQSREKPLWLSRPLQ